MVRESEIDQISRMDWDKFLPSFNPKASAFATLQIPPRTLERQPTNIRDIVSHVKNSEWVIPNFQRYYDWSPEDVREFLTSIFMGYYVGSLLLWHPQEDEKLDCIPVHGIKMSVLPSSALVVLDGQQRITSLNYAMNPPALENGREQERDKKFPGYYYVDLQVFLNDSDSEDLIKKSHKKLDDVDTFEKLLFPFYKLDDTGINQWLEDFQRYISDYNEGKQLKIYKIMEIIRKKLFNVFTEFEIPRVVLPETIAFDSVAAIFENLNSKGRRLGTFDLLNVRLSRYGVRLKELWNDTLEEHSKIKEYFEEKPGMVKLNLYIIESISLAFTKRRSCKRKDILDLFISNDYTVDIFSAKWNEMSGYIQKAIEHLEDKHGDGFGVLSKKELPYEPIIPILAALLREIHLNFEDEHGCTKKLNYWYWTSVFDNRFSSAVETKKTSDFTDMLTWFEDDSKVPVHIKNFRDDYESKLHLRDVRVVRSSVYLGVFSLLTKNGATDLQRKIIMDDKKLHMDHIFPKSKYKNRDGLQNSIINMTWLTRETNIKEKRDRLPSDYIKATIKNAYRGNTEEFVNTLEHHFMNRKCFEHLKKDQFDEFLKEREKILKRQIGIAIGAITN